MKSLWFEMDEIVYELPKDVKLSKSLEEKAFGYYKIKLFGMDYYVPITKELMRLFNIKLVDGKFVFRRYRDRGDIEDMLRYIINSTYLQVRETIGSEVYLDLSEDIKKGFEKMYAQRLMTAIDERLQVKSLEYKEDKEEEEKHEG